MFCSNCGPQCLAIQRAQRQKQHPPCSHLPLSRWPFSLFFCPVSDTGSQPPLVLERKSDVFSPSGGALGSRWLVPVPGPEGTCVGEAKEQWLSALMPTTVMCIREQQDGQAVCTNSLHSVKGSGSQGATLKGSTGFCFELVCSAHPKNSSSASPPPSHKLRQVGNFDVEIADVDVPGDLRKVDVLHSGHGPCRGC